MTEEQANKIIERLESIDNNIHNGFLLLVKVVALVNGVKLPEEVLDL